MWNTPPEWKRLVLSAMEQQGVTRAELSRRVGVSDSAITVLFRPTTAQSRLVPQIHEVLGMSPPVQSTGEADDDMAELVKLWKDLDKAERKALLGMVGVLRRTR
jgi:lambda repressor-like predicted transcriptional regulator